MRGARDLRRHAGGNRRGRERHDKERARSIRDSDARSELRGLAHDSHGDLHGPENSLAGHPEYERECDLIRREVRPIVDRVLELGEGDAAIGTVRALEAGVLDIPWSPNRFVRSRVMPARDVDGCLRILDPGAMPFPKDVLAFHEERLRKRAERERVSFGRELAVSSVYELSEPLDKLLSDTWAAV